MKQNFVSSPILCNDTVSHLNLCLCLSGLGGVPGFEVGADAPSGLAILLTPASSCSVLLFIFRLWSDRNVSTEDILWTDWDSQQIMPIVMSSHCAGYKPDTTQRHGTRGVDFWKLIKIQKCSIVSGYVLLGGPLWIKWTETFHFPDCLRSNIQQTLDATENFMAIAESLFSDPGRTKIFRPLRVIWATNFIVRFDQAQNPDLINHYIMKGKFLGEDL